MTAEDTPLKAAIEDNQLVIRIGLRTLKHSAEHCPAFYDYETHKGGMGPYETIVDAQELACDVINAMLREDEDGSTPLSDLFDESIEFARHDGSLAFKGDDDE